jgi:hypothetical protein
LLENDGELFYQERDSDKQFMTNKPNLFTKLNSKFGRKKGRTQREIIYIMSMGLILSNGKEQVYKR